MRVLISGAGVAGPTLAYWLRRYGHDPTLIEVAPALRTGGYIVDFWGAGYDVAEKMQLLPLLMQRGYRVREVRIVEGDGHVVGGFKADVFSRMTHDRFVSLPRGDLAAAIFESLGSSVETIFGDEVETLETNDEGVRVTFAQGPTRYFDSVIGADGLHSKVRALAFGPETQFERYLGFKAAAFELRDYQPRDELTYVSYARPGLQAARFALRGDCTLVFLVVADPQTEAPRTQDAQMEYLRQRFGGAGWECADIIGKMPAGERFYFDNVCQIELPRWSLGRVALIGDAASCPSLLAGEGSSLGMTAAYVLAGELAHADARHPADAFSRYERTLRPLMSRKQRAARQFASSFAPSTPLGIAVRNWVTKAMIVPWVADLAIGSVMHDNFALPEYVRA